MKTMPSNRNLAKALQTLTLLSVLIPGATWAESEFEQDREAILSMAGDYAVSFSFEEVATFDSNSETSKPHHSDALEAVRVVEDRGEFISLQHLLIVGAESDEPHLIKHWRQDWQHEPEQYLAYIGNQTWTQEPLAPEERDGVWSQTVYQVDDGPRYGGIAPWEHTGGQSMWESNVTWRPLPRREHTIRDDYDVVVGVNRHVLTHDGWIHQQDNEKVALRRGDIQVLAREIGLNRYTNDEDNDFSMADAYWEENQDFWQVTRQAWAEIFNKHDKVRIMEMNDAGEHRARRIDALLQAHNEEAHEISASSEGDAESCQEGLRAVLVEYVEPR